MVTGLTGLIVGTIVGVALIDEPRLSRVHITLDAFPRKVLGQERDDLQWRDTWSTPAPERLDAQFRDQMEGHRIAYGDDGARLTYGTYALTIVNGRVPTAVPTAGAADASETPWVVSLTSGRTTCVSEDSSREEPPPIELSDILDDDSKDVFFWLDQGRVSARTQCVLFDEEHDVGLRLEGSGWVENNAQTAGWLRDELVDIHADLVD